jgi:hypothetical protein
MARIAAQVIEHERMAALASVAVIIVGRGELAAQVPLHLDRFCSLKSSLIPAATATMFTLAGSPDLVPYTWRVSCHLPYASLSTLGSAAGWSSTHRI